MYGSVGIASSLWAEQQGFDSWQGQKIFLFFVASGLALGPTQSPIQWVPGALSLGVKQLGMKLTTRPHLVPRLRMVELYLHSLMRLVI
jgi:hypothetical protein